PLPLVRSVARNFWPPLPWTAGAPEPHQSHAQICGVPVLYSVTTSLHELVGGFIVGVYSTSLDLDRRTPGLMVWVAVTPVMPGVGNTPQALCRTAAGPIALGWLAARSARNRSAA